MAITMTETYRVELPYAAYGIEVRKGRVVKTAPIGRWALGLQYHDFWMYVQRNGGQIQKLAQK